MQRVHLVKNNYIEDGTGEDRHGAESLNTRMSNSD